MAGTNGNQFTPPSYLSPDQQDLLLAALQSNNGRKNAQNGFQNGQFANGGNFAMNGQFDTSGMDPLVFVPAHTGMSMGNFDTLDGTLNDSPFMDFLDNNENNLDFDVNGVNEQMIEDLPDDYDDDADIHDKRKSLDDDQDDDEDDDPKRHEPDGKVAKKPGRKPLTTEPTSKRKAQNRAAQRAFRERKEKHLKDLETKVAELEKASESANHENGLLRAQVDRLQMELREYRKRLSMQPASGRLPTFGQGLTSYFTNNATTTNNANFQFEFPKFGTLPGGVFSSGAVKTASPSSTTGIADTSNAAPGVLSRHDSQAGSQSPRSLSRANGSVSSTNSPAQHSGSMSSNTGSVRIESLNNDGLAGLFGIPSVNGTTGLGNSPANIDLFSGTSGASPQQASTTTSDHSSINKSRIFQFNSNPASTDSPSTSSISQYGGANSSTGTSPEPSHNSPANLSGKDQVNEQGYVCRSGSDGEISFCEKLNMACGNPRNPVPRTMSTGGANGSAVVSAQATPAATTITTAAKATSTGEGFKGIDYFATQNGGSFDPVLFGDYRDSQAAIVGDGDFTGGFFNDALPSAVDFNSPFNWDTNMSTGLTPAVQKPNPMEQAIKHADAIAEGNEEDEVVPGDNLGSMLTCHNIWDKLQENPDFKEGNLDIDGLCTELRAKARCSETGVVIDQKDVDEAIRRLPSKSGSNAGTPQAA